MQISCSPLRPLPRPLVRREEEEEEGGEGRGFVFLPARKRRGRANEIIDPTAFFGGWQDPDFGRKTDKKRLQHVGQQKNRERIRKTSLLHQKENEQPWGEAGSLFFYSRSRVFSLLSSSRLCRPPVRTKPLLFFSSSVGKRGE